MCNCKTEIEDKLREAFKAKEPTGAGHDVELQGYGFGISGDTMFVRPTTSYRATAIVPKKTGGSRLLTTRGVVAFAFCPFCGIKINKD